jgi:hypothetical protein
MRDIIQDKIDQASNDYNRTKDPKYKTLWYKLIKEQYEHKRFRKKDRYTIKP